MFSEAIKGKDKFWLFAISTIFIAVNSFLTIKGILVFSALPILLFFFLIAIYSIETFFYLTVFFTPLSVGLRYFLPSVPVDLSMPTEGMLIVLFFILIYKFLREKTFNRKILLHPVSLAIYFNLAWLFVTTISSSMPLVSAKFLIARFWFVVPMYFFASHVLFDFKKAQKFTWLYVVPLLLVSFYMFANLMNTGLYNNRATNYSMVPFYNDHTAFGAIIAFYIPIVVGFLFNKQYKNITKYIIVFVTVILFAALILSYCRAAWVSLFGALGFLILIIYKIKLRTLFLVGFVLVTLFLSFRIEVEEQMGKNQQDASLDLSKQIQSITNTSTDASNMERINRWKCAFKMFSERPFLGWGPGTYMFQYAPFQMYHDRTIISTNAGDWGNAHSEYIGPLAESGVFGTLSVLLILTTFLYTALRLYQRTTDKAKRIFILSVILAVSTYFIHGFLNNFLDTDKASVPVWGFIAVIVGMDAMGSEE